MKRHHLIILAVLALFILPAALSVWSGLNGRRGAFIGRAAPPITGEMLDGEPLTAPSATGEVVVLNFWATWCGPCRAEMPVLAAAHAPDDGVRVLAVNHMERAGTVRDYLATLDEVPPVLLDPDGRLNRAYNVGGYPTTAFIAPDGTLYALHLGPLTEAQLAERISVGRAYAVGSGGSASTAP